MQSGNLGQLVRDFVEEQGPSEFIELASAVARAHRVAVQKVEWEIRVLLHTGQLALDEDFRIVRPTHPPDKSSVRALA